MGCRRHSLLVRVPLILTDLALASRWLPSRLQFLFAPLFFFLSFFLSRTCTHPDLIHWPAGNFHGGHEILLRGYTRLTRICISNSVSSQIPATVYGRTFENDREDLSSCYQKSSVIAFTIFPIASKGRRCPTTLTCYIFLIQYQRCLYQHWHYNAYKELYLLYDSFLLNYCY